MTNVIPVSNPSTGPTLAEEKRTSASEHMIAGNYDLAISDLSAALEFHPNAAPLWAMRAESFLRIESPKQAQLDATEALKHNPNSARALRVRGRACYALGLLDETLTDLAAAQKVDFDEDVEVLLRDVSARLKVSKPKPRTTPSHRYPTSYGYTTEMFRDRFITQGIKSGKLPQEAHRIANIVNLTATADPAQPLYFWQLFSLLGSTRIDKVVRIFYQIVFADPEDWFRKSFSNISSMEHHVATQSAMWKDVMGGGKYYHGGDYRLSFHHTHNAIKVMTNEGAKRWAMHMQATLSTPGLDVTEDERALPTIVEFINFFMDKYAEEFKFQTVRL
jgi:truncated hemoglobin YjbI